MGETWVTNASPVIVLAKAGLLELAEALCEQLLLPDTVAEELLAGPEGDPARSLVLAGWGKRISPHSVPPSLLEWGLGRGETAVLAVALENTPCTVLLDDWAARSAARTLGLPILGTLGLIARAKVAGLLPSAAAAVEKVRKAGLHVDDAVVVEVLKSIDE